MLALPAAVIGVPSNKSKALKLPAVVAFKLNTKPVPWSAKGPNAMISILALETVASLFTA